MLKIGVLGASNLAKDHIRILLELKSQFELIGFYDPCDKLAEELMGSFSIKRFSMYKNLLEEVECIDIVSPTIKHYEFASIALRKSKHIFIEKPLTQTIDEAKSLISLSREASVKVQIGSIERFNPAFLKSIDFVKRPMYIETHRLNHYSTHVNDISVVMDLMMNDIDVILSIVKSGVRKVSASGASVFSDAFDIVSARIEFDNGCVANLTASRISMKNMRKTRFFQKDAYISVDFLDKKSEVFKIQDLEGVANPFDIVLDLGEGKQAKKIIFDQPEVELTNAIKEELKTFYEAITNDTTPIVSISDGYLALDIAQKIIDKINASPILLTDNI